MIHWGDINYADQPSNETKSVAKIVRNSTTANCMLSRIVECAKRNISADSGLSPLHPPLTETILHSQSVPVIIELSIRPSDVVLPLRGDICSNFVPKFLKTVNATIAVILHHDKS